MARKIDVQSYTIAASTELNVALQGNYFIVLDANLTPEISLDENETPVPFAKGLAYAGSAFEKVRIKNPSGSTALTIQLGVASGEIIDFRNIINGAISTRSGDTLAHGAKTVGTSAVEIVAASTSRTRLTVQNLGSADIYVGGASVTTANGLKVPANGGSRVIENGATYYGISGTAGQDVRYEEESV